MAVLAKCWLILECCLIPDGFMKWFFLSFYINPFFLIFCQFFLWIKTFQKWIFFLIFLLDHYVFSHILRVLRRFLIMSRSSSKFIDGNTTEAEDDDVWYEVTDSYSSLNPTCEILLLHYQVSCEIPKIVNDVYIESVHQETVFVCSSSDLDDEITSSFGSSSPISSYSFGSHGDMEETSNTPSSSYTLPEDQEAADNATRNGLIDFLTPAPVVKPNEDKKDSFYKLYTERMSWFDLLNQERTCGLNALLTKKQYLGGEKRILKSLESDFEMVYVAQTCLSWEALHDQYRKLEDIVSSCTNPDGALCISTLVSRFQRFQILLERFMEDERSEKGKRYWNFIQKRSSVKSLLQVPDVSDFCTLKENENDDQEGRNSGLMIRATDVLRTIEKCMRSFKSFIEVEENKPWWKESRHFSWNRSPLEDPRDYNFLHDLTHTLRQKELWMKDLKGKKRCWLKRRVKIMEDVQKKDMMFAMIELKLVSRVLMMSIISTSQLQWCKQKLDNIQISHGRVTRPCTSSLLFPPS